MQSIFEKVQATIAKHHMLTPGDPVLVGISGGADSVALLHILHALGYKLFAAHVNHNLRGREAMRDQKFVAQLCNQLKIPFLLLDANVKQLAAQEGVSIEVAGRNIRYRFFEAAARSQGAKKIAVAHTKNDSAETVLLNLIRGSATHGQRGIPPVNGAVIRPMIDVERYEIEAYLAKNHIEFMLDSTNTESVFTRNLVRNKVLPELKTVNPNIVATIVRNANIIREESACLDEIISDIAKKRISFTHGAVQLDLNGELHVGIKRLLALKAIERLKGDTFGLTQKHIDEILSLSRGGSKFILPKYLTASYNYGILNFIAGSRKPNKFCYRISGLSRIYIPEIDKAFRFEILNGYHGTFDENCCLINLDGLQEPLYLRSRKMGDRFIPSGMQSHKKLQDFFVDKKVPSFLRDSIPILATDTRIAAVLGMRVSTDFLVHKDTQRVLKITEEI